MGYYVVRELDHLGAIAHRFSVAPEAIWEHRSNTALRRARGDGSILRAGDLVFIPDPPERPRTTVQAGSTATFQAEAPRVHLRVRITDPSGQPRAGEPYRLETPGEILTGQADGDGVIDVRVRVVVRRARLYLDRCREVHDVTVGGLDPVSELTGVQMRLRHLGHYVGPIDGRLGEGTRAAIRHFQTAAGIEASGEPDDATREALVNAHGC